MLEHSEIGWIRRTGYPSWNQDDPCCEQEPDYDAHYEEQRDRDLFD